MLRNWFSSGSNKNLRLSATKQVRNQRGTSHSGVTQPIRRNAAGNRFQFEPLEDRTVPAFAGLPHPVSINPAGTAMGDSQSFLDNRSISSDGKYQVFTSLSSDLVATDTNGTYDVFVRNLTTGATTLVSVNSAGTSTSNSVSYGGVISNDGRYVAFISASNDLTAVPQSGYQIYRRDLQTNTTVLVSYNSAGAASANDWSEQASISGDGRYVAFRSYGTNLVAGLSDLNASTDVFVRDVQLGTTKCVSVNTSGTSVGNYNSTDPTISNDGSRVVFSSYALDLVVGALDNNNVLDLYVRNLLTDTTLLASQASAAAGTGEAGASYQTRSISSDGRYQVFSSNSTTYDHATSDRNGTSDVFVRDLVLGTTKLVSVNSIGTASSNGYSDSASISGNGRYVVYRSSATDLTAGVTGGYHVYRKDLLTNTTVLVDVDVSGLIAANNWGEQPSVSSDGRFVAFRTYATDLLGIVSDTNGDTDIYVRDLTLNLTKAISVTPAGTVTGNFSSTDPTISNDGSTIVFRSSATNLVTGVLDNNNVGDLFARNLTTNVTSLISKALGTNGTGEAAANHQGRSLSANGQFEVFVSYSTTFDHVTPDLNGTQDVFVRDIVAGTTKIVSVNTAGTASSNGYSDEASISADGRYIVFRSTATDMTAGVTGNYNIYRRDLLTNTTALVSIDSTNTVGANNWSQNPTVSSDGRYVAFSSYATDIVTGVTDANGERDIFVRDMNLNTTKVASVTPAATATGDSWADAPFISADGSMVAFSSPDSNLASGVTDSNGAQDLFVRNLTTNTTLLVSRVGSGASTGDAAAYKTTQSISDDGRYEVFSSYSTIYQNAKPDFNGSPDIFIRDRVTGTIALVTHNLANTAAANALSDQAAISGNGQYVVFRSNATDLVATPLVAQTQIYRWDRLTNTTVLVSMNSSNTSGSNFYNHNPSISDNGNIIAWESEATDTTAVTDSNAVADVIVRNMTTSINSLVSINLAGTATGNSGAYSPKVSGDGSRVAFTSYSYDLTALTDFSGSPDIFVRTLATSTTVLASRNLAGTAAANLGSQYPTISNDGLKVAYLSGATDIIATDTNGTLDDVYVFNVSTLSNTLVSRNLAGTGSGNGASFRPSISGDGNFVVFDSYSTDINATATNGQVQVFRRNLSAGTTQLISINSGATNGGNNQSYNASVSDNGNIVAYETYATDLVATPDGNGLTDVFVRNVTGGTTTLASINSAGTGTANHYSFNAVIAAAGGFVTWSTYATNVLAGVADYNTTGEDIYGRDLAGGTNYLVSAKGAGVFAAGFQAGVSLSSNGQKIAWVNSNNTIVANDVNGSEDVFVFDTTTQTNVLISVNLAGTESSTWYSREPVISANGNLVAFRSGGDNLAALDTSFNSDIFLRNISGATTELISVNSAGTSSGLGDCYDPTMSSNGNIVAFRSSGINYVAGFSDTNSDTDVFVRNRTSSTTSLASSNSAGLATANGGSYGEYLSDDGTRLVFQTYGTNLLAGITDFNGTGVDIYARNISAGTNLLVSIKATGLFAGSSGADQPSISDNGQKIAYHSYSNNLAVNDFNGYDDVFVWDQTSTNNTLVSVATTGFSGDWFGTQPAISGNGQFVAFASGASNLTANDSNVYYYDIFVRDLTAGTTQLVSFESTGAGSSNSHSDLPTISANGNIVGFRSLGTNLVTGFADTNADYDIFVRNRTTNVTTLASVNSTATGTANSISYSPMVSADGSRLIWGSPATDVIAGMYDFNGAQPDIFARNLTTSTNVLVSIKAAGLFTANGQSDQPSISNDGKRVAFRGLGNNYVALPDVGYEDVFVWDETAATVSLVSINAAGTSSGNYYARFPVISGNGRYVAFSSGSSDLVALDAAYNSDIFRRDLTTNTTVLISINAAGTAGGNFESEKPAINDDGSVIAYRSTSTDLTATTDTNGTYDTFVRDVTAATTSLVSRNALGAGNGFSDQPLVVSADGSVVIFLNTSSDLVAGVTDTNATYDDFAVFRNPVAPILVGPVTPDPRNTFVPSVTVVLSRVVNLATFTQADFTLTRNGGGNLLTAGQTVTYVSGTTYQINNLNGLTNLAGTYLLTVNMVGVNDPLGDAGAGSANDTWVMDLSTPVPTSVAPVVPNPRNTTVSTIDFTFSEVLNLATLTAADLTLTSGGPNLLTGSEAVTFVSGSTYRISGLSGLTGTDGVYTLTVFGAGVQDLAGNAGSGSASTSWTADFTGPKVTNAFVDGTAWSGAFRTAAGNATYGYPVQTGAGQLTTLPWNTINTIYIKFSENVTIVGGNLGVRGVTVPTYAVSTFSYDNVNFVAKWVLTAAIDTDWLILDLDGAGGSAVSDALGNKLGGTFTESVSTFPTTGVNGVNFKYRFKVAVGDADRNGAVRNPDLNLVRANLFIDAGAGGYSIYRDIDGNGLTRNADLNAVRSHLFIDPPGGPGPTRPIRGGNSGSSTHGRNATNGFAGTQLDATGRDVVSHRRLPVAHQVAVLDELFADFA